MLDVRIRLIVSKGLEEMISFSTFITHNSSYLEYNSAV